MAERANGAIEGLEDRTPAERRLDRRNRVDRIDCEGTSGDVLGLQLARGTAPVLRLGARPPCEGGSVFVGE